MTFNYSNLSHIDFEDLCRDIARHEFGMRFEAFGPGPDGGVDGRHSKGKRTTILQAKHYAGSKFSNLKTAIRKDAEKISLIDHDRYLIFTSLSMTPTKKEKLLEAANIKSLQASDIWGKEDLDAALRYHPEIAKSHMKLWLNETAVLEKILHSGLEAYTQTTKDEIIDELRVYVRNPSFDAALKKLSELHVLIVSGPPGVGKTTLAKMIGYRYLEKEWQFVAIDSLDDGFKKIDDQIPTVYFFDDFLGRTALNKQALLQHDNALTSFVGRIRRSKNARFILTTRAHIFEEAGQISDRVSDGRFQLSKYLLDVGVYTRRIKAHIFFNHICASNLTTRHFRNLLLGDSVTKIIDHKNYNPRIISEFSSALIRDIEPHDYASEILMALDNPALVWEKPYNNLKPRDKYLLISLYFSPDTGESLSSLRQIFHAVNRRLAKHYFHQTEPGDFEAALKNLESGFISISGKKADFVNPGVRDFLKSSLVDIDLFSVLISAAIQAKWARNIWRHLKRLSETSEESLSVFALFFADFAKRIEAEPSSVPQKHSQINYTYYVSHDLSLSDRLWFLLELHEASGSKEFLDRFFDLAENSDLRMVPDDDEIELPRLIAAVRQLKEHYPPQSSEAEEHLSIKLGNILEDGLGLEETIRVVEAISENLEGEFSNYIGESMDSCVESHFEVSTYDGISDLNSESELEAHKEQIELLANLQGRDAYKVLDKIDDRIIEIQTDHWDHDEPSYRSSSPVQRANEYSDQEVKSLFSTLLR